MNDKIRGQSADIVWIDEAATFEPSGPLRLQDLVDTFRGIMEQGFGSSGEVESEDLDLTE